MYTSNYDTAFLLCQYFLSDIDWERIGSAELGTTTYTSPNPVAGQLSMAVIGLALTTARFNRANMVLYRLWERQYYIRIHDRCEDFCQEISPSTSTRQARIKFTETLVRETQESSSITADRDEIEQAIHNILRRGSRWRELVDATQSEEIVLVDQDLPVMPPLQSIGIIINTGDDAQFKELKDFLLDPKYEVKANCLRLSGVAQMIIDLADAPESSELRQYLCATIENRIRCVLGNPGLAGHIPQSGTYEWDTIQETIVDLCGIVDALRESYVEEDHDLDIIGRDVGVYYNGFTAHDESG